MLTTSNDQTSSNSNNNNNNNRKNNNNNNNADNNNNNANNRIDRKQRSVYPLSEICGKTKHSTKECYFVDNAANKPPPRNRKRAGQSQVEKHETQNNESEIIQPLN